MVILSRKSNNLEVGKLLLRLVLPNSSQPLWVSRKVMEYNLHKIVKREAYLIELETKQNSRVNIQGESLLSGNRVLVYSFEMIKALDSSTKVVIWGYPLHSHTQSYVHFGWFKSFERLGYQVYWFHDDNYPRDFDFQNCIFIAEGYADRNIPIVKSSVYFVHCCINPSKYLSAEARLIDMRFNVDSISDVNYSYSKEELKLLQLDSVSFYEAQACDNQLSTNWRRGVSGYEAIYISWATDLLPDEFNFDDRYIRRSRKIHWVGTIADNNIFEIKKFAEAAKNSGVKFVHHDPWKRPLNLKKARKLVQKSFIAPDIRGGASRVGEDGSTQTGGNHKLIGYIPCRTFKNISYGQLGITNSSAVAKLFGGEIVFSQDEEELFKIALESRSDHRLVLEQMQYVQSNHTYLNRAKVLLRVVDLEG